MGLGLRWRCWRPSPGASRKLTRAVVFLPVVIGLGSSSPLWYWLFDQQVGLFNRLLQDLHIIAHPIVWFVDADLASGR